MARMMIELEQEVDGRWMAEIDVLPGALAYGATRDEAARKVEALALRILAERLENGENVPALSETFAVA
jgi:predicted RNase H-like HicB family nuclease